MPAEIELTERERVQADFDDNELFDLHWGESEFALREVVGTLSQRFGKAGAYRCLEIGCGAGLLLARLRARYPAAVWEGIEPIGQGFARFETALDKLSSRYQLTIHRTSLEAFPEDRKFDFIFSVNVFEHVDSWRDCIAKAHRMLAAGGTLMILTPNYTFPYEPHYGLPVVLNKETTAKVFAKEIADYDARNKTAGLWQSLNFIKKRDVMAFCERNSIPLDFDEHVIDHMIEKLWTDEAFAQRQKHLAGLAKLLYRFGITKLFRLWPLSLLVPYQKIVIGT